MKINRLSVMAAVAVSFGVLVPAVFAADAADAQRSGAESRERIQKPAAKEERVYGSQLMTREERREHRQKMRNAASAEEREQIRKEHHQKMKERAKERGVKLPDAPPSSKQGTDPGTGTGGAYRP